MTRQSSRAMAREHELVCLSETRRIAVPPFVIVVGKFLDELTVPVLVTPQLEQHCLSLTLCRRFGSCQLGRCRVFLPTPSPDSTSFTMPWWMLIRLYDTQLSTKPLEILRVGHKSALRQHRFCELNDCDRAMLARIVREHHWPNKAQQSNRVTCLVHGDKIRMRPHLLQHGLAALSLNKRVNTRLVGFEQLPALEHHPRRHLPDHHQTTVHYISHRQSRHGNGQYCTIGERALDIPATLELDGGEPDDFFRGLRILVGGIIAGGHLVDKLVVQALFLSLEILNGRLPHVLRAVLFLLGPADQRRTLAAACGRVCSATHSGRLWRISLPPIVEKFHCLLATL